MKARRTILAVTAALSAFLSVGAALTASPAEAAHRRRRHYRVVTPYYGDYGYSRNYYGYDRGSYRANSRRPWGDLDRDGIPNKYDRDKDGDGRRNGRDDHPKNPFRR